ncbi:large neutral amino acids transporter small subunit 2-like [Saccostrea echinata]|uniref:large neutral amino acids transporter small subunit 2-like n=1 Tax=Saccostrea echinata TaxID=191078 RepID=UPI002A7ED3FD|nr:large neutral amino acids transporter small subunit 2-like [Saccostrea echinata]
MADQSTVQIETKEIRMKRSINLLHCVAVLVAVTGHISIFISPSVIFSTVGSIGLTVIVWVFAGLLNISVCLCFVELATVFPSAGGPYAYVTNAFGGLSGFIIMWGYTILIIGPFWAYLCYTASVYILKPFFPLGCEPPAVGVKILGAWILTTLVVLNCIYMKYVTKVQTFLTASKVVCLILIITLGAVVLSRGHETKSNFEDIFENTSTEPGSIALGIFYSLFVYGGWQIVCGLMEEVKDPSRDIPRAVYISFTIVIVQYVLVNISYFLVLTPTQFLSSNAVALTFTQVHFPYLSPVVSILVGMSAVGVLNASIMGHSRVIFAGARNGHMPSIFGMLHMRYLTPWPAIFLKATWGAVMLFSGGIEIFMQFIQAFSSVMTLFVVSALLYLRWKQPELLRPYTTSLVNAIFVLLYQSLVLLFALYQEPERIGLALVIIAAGAPVYWLGVSWKSKPDAYKQISKKVTIAVQKSLLISKTS